VRTETNSTFQHFATTSKGNLDKEDTTAPSWAFLIGAQNSVAEDELTVILKVNGTFLTFKLNTVQMPT